MGVWPDSYTGLHEALTAAKIACDRARKDAPSHDLPLLHEVHDAVDLSLGSMRDLRGRIPTMLDLLKMHGAGNAPVDGSPTT